LQPHTTHDVVRTARTIGAPVVFVGVASAIEVRGVSKRFRLFHEHYTSLKERVIHFGRIPYEDFWAIDENGIDLDIEPGTTVGILGHNGSGKSTLLKLVAGILQPTTGEIVTHGRLAALLELGAGFHPDMTGRENVFMNASILGLSTKQTRAVFDEIVAFSELERFIDMQVRHYSSGMYVRLGFAVAVNVDPDILLIDEVLSVGDEAFQRKCIERVKQFQRDGRTILFVTHTADLIRRICDRAVVLEHGCVAADAAPPDAVRVFRENMAARSSIISEEQVRVLEAVAGTDEGAGTAEREERATHEIHITKVTFEHPGQADGRETLLPHEPLTIRVGFHASEATDNVQMGIAIHDEEGNHIFGTNTRLAGASTSVAAGAGETEFAFEEVPLLDGTYRVTFGIQSTDEGVVYDWQEQRYVFSVTNPSRDLGRVAFPITVHFNNSALAS